MSRPERPSNFGRDWKSVQRAKLAPEAQARVQANAARELRMLTLKALREQLELTQVEVSRAANMTQPELSRLESRGDHLTSTLRRYVEALGGELEVSAVFGKRRVRLSDV
jgi:hypothetical protein